MITDGPQTSCQNKKIIKYFENLFKINKKKNKK